MMTPIIEGIDKEGTIDIETGKDIGVMTVFMMERDWSGMIPKTRTGQKMRTIAEMQIN